MGDENRFKDYGICLYSGYVVRNVIFLREFLVVFFEDSKRKGFFSVWVFFFISLILGIESYFMFMYRWKGRDGRRKSRESG